MEDLERHSKEISREGPESEREILRSGGECEGDGEDELKQDREE